MPRFARSYRPASLNHVIARGNNGQATFVDEIDYRRFLAELSLRLSRSGGTLQAYCLTPKRTDLLLRTPGALSQLMHSLLSQYALTFNRRYDHIGHLYQDRFESRMIEDERYGSAVIGFIHSIPVRSGLAASSLDWPWSSAREYAGLTETGLLKIAKSPTDASFEPQLEEDRRFLRDPEKTLDAIFQSELGQIALLNAQSARAKFVGRAISAGYHRGEIAKYLGCSLSTVFRLSRNRSK